MQRAFSLVTLTKSAEDSGRTFAGIATSPETDRVGDVIEPAGVKFARSVPLLLYHDARRPIGEARLGKATQSGVPFDAQISQIDRPGAVQDRINEAIDSLHAKPPLIKAVSIGFRALAEPVYIKETGGLRYPSIEVMELSLVTVPANQAATITAIKSICTQELAALGTELEEAPPTHKAAGASASTRVVKLTTPKGPKMPKPISEQIKGFEATRQSKAAERDAIMEKSADEGVTLDKEQKEQYDTLALDVKELDEHIGRLRELEKSNRDQAKTVVAETKEQADNSRGPRPVITITDTMPADIAFGAMVLCKAHSFMEFQKGNFVTPLDVAKQRYPSNALVQGYFQQKAAVTGGTMTDSNWAAALLAPAQVLDAAFIEYLRPKTLIDRFGTVQNGVQIPSMQKVPFNVKVQSQTSGASANWVGEGKGKPVTKFNTTSATLLPTKIAAISVITQELARFSRPGAEGLVRNELGKAVVAKADTSLVDPALAAVSGVNPASLTNGLVALSSAGTSAANVLTDVQNLIAPFLLAGYDVSQLVLLMPNTLALTLSLMQNSLGQDSFKGMTVTGGSLAGIPVLASQYLASGASYGNMIIAVSAENIALADDGNVSIDVSREASIEMSDAPANEVVTPTASAYMVSMYQSNSLAIRAEREIGWLKMRSNAVVYMDDVNWGSIGSPV